MKLYYSDHTKWDRDEANAKAKANYTILTTQSGIKMKLGLRLKQTTILTGGQWADVSHLYG